MKAAAPKFTFTDFFMLEDNLLKPILIIFCKIVPSDRLNMIMLLLTKIKKN